MGTILIINKFNNFKQTNFVIFNKLIITFSLTIVYLNLIAIMWIVDNIKEKEKKNDKNYF